jgi:hypothetical protein
MGSIAPPDGWTVVTGTWGTDLNREDTIVFEGVHSIHLEDTTVASAVYAPPFVIATYDSSTDATIIPSNIPFYVYLRQDDDGNALNTVTVIAETYDLSNTLVDTVTWWNARLGTSGKWYSIGGHVAPSGAHNYIKIKISKAARAFDTYIGGIVAEKAPPGWTRNSSGAQVIPNTGAWTTMVIDATSGGDSEVDLTTTTNAVRLFVAGRYTMTASVRVDADITAGQTLDIRIKKTDSGGSSVYWYGKPAVGADRVASISFVDYASYGDTYSVQLATSTAAKTLVNDGSYVYFHGSLIGR